MPLTKKLLSFPRNKHIKAYWAQWDSLMFDNEVLYHVNGKETLSSDAVIQQLVVPKELGEQVLQQLHGTR